MGAAHKRSARSSSVRTRAASAASRAAREESTAASRPDHEHDNDNDGDGDDEARSVGDGTEDEDEPEPLQDDITAAAAAKSALGWDEAVAQVQQSLAAHRQSTEELDRGLTKAWHVVCGMAMNPDKREGRERVGNMSFDFPSAILGQEGFGLESLRQILGIVFRNEYDKCVWKEGLAGIASLLMFREGDERDLHDWRIMMLSAIDHGGPDIHAIYAAMRSARRDRLARTSATVAKCQSTGAASKRPDPTQPVFASVALSMGIRGFLPADVRAATKALYAPGDGSTAVGRRDSGQPEGSPSLGEEEENEEKEGEEEEGEEEEKEGEEERDNATPAATPGRQASVKRKRVGRPKSSKRAKRRKADELLRGDGGSSPERSPAQQPDPTLPQGDDDDTVVQQRQPQHEDRDEEQDWLGDNSHVDVRLDSSLLDPALADADQPPERPAPWDAISSDATGKGHDSDMESASIPPPSLGASSPLMPPSPELGRGVGVDCVGTGQAEHDASGLGGQDSTAHGSTGVGAEAEAEDMSTVVVQAEAELKTGTTTVLVGGGSGRLEALRRLGDIPKALLAHGRWLNSDLIDAVMPMVASSSESALYIPAQSIISARDGKALGSWNATDTASTAGTNAGDGNSRLSAALGLLATNTVLVVPNTGPPGHRGKHWVALRVDLGARQVHLDDSCPSPQHVQLGGLFRDALVSGHLADRVSQVPSDEAARRCQWPVVPNLGFPQQANGDDCGIYALASQVYSACGRPWPSPAACTFVPSLWRAFFFAWTQGIPMRAAVRSANLGRARKETRAMANQAVELAEVADILLRGSRDIALPEKTDSLVAASRAARDEKLAAVRELAKDNFLYMINREHLAALETQITACAAAAAKFLRQRAAVATTSATLLGCVGAHDTAAHLVSRADDLDSQAEKIRAEWVTASQVALDGV
ncbi:hypothetical protein UCDDA912_g10008 [Diaporthe ampelina]|uniref:Ubiquitin-like protease family profile domain-containing protein n=1 Tax=Diaporthe ampelina TaxID=1214573 RepID=A0A0G2H488_9PEZI|nr:hypothetical protein UCDDA912_g10008 [Diaporthe ampelina]